MLSSAVNRPLIAFRWLLYTLLTLCGFVLPFLADTKGGQEVFKGLWGAGAVACFLTLYSLTPLEKTRRLTFQRLGLILGETGLVALLIALFGGPQGPLALFAVVPPLLISIEHHWRYGIASSLVLSAYLWFGSGELAQVTPAILLGLTFSAIGAALNQVDELRRALNSEDDFSKLDKAYHIARRETNKRQEHEQELHRERRRFEGLVSVAQGLSEEREEESLLQRIVEVACDQLNARSAVVLLLRNDRLIARAESGLSQRMVESLQKACDLKLLTQLAASGYPLTHGSDSPYEREKTNQQLLSRLAHLLDKDARRGPAEPRIDQLLGVPLSTAQDHQPFGLLLVINSNLDQPFTQAEARYLNVLSTNAAVALKNILFTAQLERSHWELIQALAQAIEAKDSYTSNHVGRVRDISVEIARVIGLDREKIRIIAIAATLHDVGKISTPDRVLLKPGPLTDEEYEIMKQHAANGAQILRGINSLPPEVEPMVRHHHERWDGRGYPDGKSGKDIPLGAQIIAIADCFDAMTYDRPYRNGFPKQEALQKMELGCGTQFNPKLLCAFFAIQGYEPRTEPTAIDTYHAIIGKLNLGGGPYELGQASLVNRSHKTGSSPEGTEQRRKPLLMERN